MRNAPLYLDLPAGEFALWRIFSRADFDPVTMTAIAIGGSAISAGGTLLAGSNAAFMGEAQQNEENYQATQDKMNSAAAIASGQRRMLNTQLTTNLTASRAVASSAAGGVETTTGSPVSNQAQIIARGRYAAGLDLWNGENEATGDLNKATAAQYQGELDVMGGQMQQEASYFSAAGTLASGAGNAYKIYGMGSTPNAAALTGNGSSYYG